MFSLRTCTWPQLQAAKEMTRAREKALEESGLSHGHITEAGCFQLCAASSLLQFHVLYAEHFNSECKELRLHRHIGERETWRYAGFAQYPVAFAEGVWHHKWSALHGQHGLRPNAGGLPHLPHPGRDLALPVSYIGREFLLCNREYVSSTPG